MAVSLAPNEITYFAVRKDSTTQRFANTRTYTVCSHSRLDQIDVGVATELQFALELTTNNDESAATTSSGAAPRSVDCSDLSSLSSTLAVAGSPLAALAVRAGALPSAIAYDAAASVVDNTTLVRRAARAPSIATPDVGGAQLTLTFPAATRYYASVVASASLSFTVTAVFASCAFARASLSFGSALLIGLAPFAVTCPNDCSGKKANRRATVVDCVFFFFCCGSVQVMAIAALRPVSAFARATTTGSVFVARLFGGDIHLLPPKPTMQGPRMPIARSIWRSW